jgi:hypothetical protein
MCERVGRPFRVWQDADSLAVVIDKSGSQLTGANTEAELSVYNVADVVNRVLGLQPVHPEFAPAFLKANAFTKVKANVLIAVESLGEEYLSNHHMSGLQQLRNDHHSFKLLGHRYPASVAAMSATLATGASPTAHGVVADTWMNDQGIVGIGLVVAGQSRRSRSLVFPCVIRVRRLRV